MTAADATSCTLRHYGQVGLLPPSRIGANGYRYYDEREKDATPALRAQLDLLHGEQGRIRRRIESVGTTLGKSERGERLVAAEVFEEFDHTQYKDEVTERWRRGLRTRRPVVECAHRGTETAVPAGSARYRRGLRPGMAGRADAGQCRGPGDPRRHYEWVIVGRRPSAKEFARLGEMYVADEHSASTTSGTERARWRWFVTR
ncbi:MerR family DNA-binding transcriptional regulator [Nocardia carnea]|uniref:MerR family DNA-binding transcriptional regulator n=1 Tax=Nocardia carnea TaxID=37328 RepID=UPI003D78ABAD